MGEIMRILFTGASSFTGYWFVRELSRAGHSVTALFQRHPEEYVQQSRQRVEQLMPHCSPIYGSSFGDERFLAAVEGQPHWDLFCHHAAYCEGYKRPDFDYCGALSRNCHNLERLLALLAERGCRRIALTGSLFEGGEGLGEAPRLAFSPYGLSKELTARVFAYFAPRSGLQLAKFVIPNPFGPLEESRFTSYLAREWLHHRIPVINSPDYVRDNIHVGLLARCYRHFVEGDLTHLSPSGYVMRQGDFAKVFSQQMEGRLGLPCPLQMAEQSHFDEPRVRIGRDFCGGAPFGWDEKRAWDQLADYYLEAFAGV